MQEGFSPNPSVVTEICDSSITWAWHLHNKFRNLYIAFRKLVNLQESIQELEIIITTWSN